MSALSAPILVIDSSLGGLTIVKALRERLPHERVTFFADLARAPYHVRSPEAVERFVWQMVSFAGSKTAKHVVLACDVAASVMMPLPAGWTSLIEPAARAAVEAAGTLDKPVIGVLSSAAAIERRTLERALVKRRVRARYHLRTAHTLSMLAEEGHEENDTLMMIAGEQALEPLISRGADVVLLASSSLSPARSRLASLVSGHAKVVDSSVVVAEDIARRLTRAGLLCPAIEHDAFRQFTWYLTDESPAIFDRAERLAGFELPPPGIVALEQLESLDVETRLRSTG